MGAKTYKRTIRKSNIGDIVNDIVNMPTDGTARLTVSFGRSRSDAQNRLSFLWYSFISSQIDGEAKEDARRYCKLTYGVPILLEQDDEFVTFWSAVQHLSYGQQLLSMDYVPVTSRFTVKQFTEYLEAMERGYAQDGIILPTSDDAYYEALGYKRVA